MLDEPHMRPLAAYVRALNGAGHGWAPDFDPLDGGARAQLLLLLEKPGPGLHSGFVSRDNDTPTAATIRDGMAAAGVPRRGTAIWNIVPWWNGTMAVRTPELRAGAAEIRVLIHLFPELRSVVLAGKSAQRAAPLVGNLAVFACVHPSPNARAGPASSAAWRNLPDIWREAWRAGGTRCLAGAL